MDEANSDIHQGRSRVFSMSGATSPGLFIQLARVDAGPSPPFASAISWGDAARLERREKA